jgi:ADP-ribosylglycohydrolase
MQSEGSKSCEDTDTTAYVIDALVGLLYGLNNIPKLKRFRFKEAGYS